MIDINEHLPQLVINASDGVHVVPISLTRDVINGKQHSSILTEPVIKEILKEWLEITTQ